MICHIGTTKCKWDNIINFELLWKQYERVIKDDGAICLFGIEPFASKLRLSNLKIYRYDWIWEKTVACNFMNAKKQPKKMHESILCFYKKQPTYNPQFEKGKKYTDNKKTKYIPKAFNKDGKQIIIPFERQTCNLGTRYPKSIIKFSNATGNRHPKSYHPTQKPVSLLEYLIKTYTNEGETVLDNCMGSGSAGVACVNTNRNFVGIELDKEYFEIAKKRIKETKNIWNNV